MMRNLGVPAKSRQKIPLTALFSSVHALLRVKKASKREEPEKTRAHSRFSLYVCFCPSPDIICMACKLEIRE